MAELGTKPQLHRHTGRPQCQDGVEGKVEANGAEEKEHGVDDNYYGIAASARAAMSKVRSVHAAINETWPIRMERQAPHPRSPSCLPMLDYYVQLHGRRGCCLRHWHSNWKLTPNSHYDTKSNRQQSLIIFRHRAAPFLLLAAWTR